jgi:hypothetical protein
MSDMIKPSRRFSGTPGKRQNPVGASLTEKIVSASTVKRDVANFDAVCAARPLKRPKRRTP